MRILLIGDVVGKGGRKAVRHLTAQLRREFNCSYCIANGENAAGGAGMTEKCILEMTNAGCDVITSGDHVWDQREFSEQIRGLSNVLRPHNLPEGQPGRGYQVFNIPAGGKILVINLIGRVFMRPEIDNPFSAVDRILDEVGHRTPVVFVDFHAEATSEKIAMGRYLQGRASCVFGTHTHVQTADEQLFDSTAYISDIGMVGASNSVLGRDVKAVVQRFRTGMPNRFHVVDENVVLHGAVVDVDPATGRATDIQRIVRPYEEASA